MIAVPHPCPLATCPGRDIWSRRSGQDYLVFVDESFRGFLELRQVGYFCHAAVGIPQLEYERLKMAVAPIFADYQRITALNPSEFKHADFRSVEWRDRRRIALRLANALTTHGAFIAGFYTTSRDFVLECIRTDLLETDAEVPEEFGRLWEDVAARRRAEFTSAAGHSRAIADLLVLPIAAVVNLLASFECRYRVVYDPRERREDRAVARFVGEYADAIRTVSAKMNESRRAALEGAFHGFECQRTSEDELGLQMADLMAGEIRVFFEGNEGLRSYGATRRLITPQSEEPMVTIAEVDGHHFKTGALQRMPGALARCFSAPDPQGRYVLPFFRNLLASGQLTCYSTWGQPRDVMAFERLIWDQVD